ncbi:peptidase inhibitor family I36 protein [Streptomyces lanatus]|uniref:Peptidase inhibitor family I36 protein n=1 Tax=Streptomyces lanatus TaxID=66900 RepID=A0ABV1XHP9_9ACTN|nr:peptidase inhibitor family I36 protein [Streptomyces lanatus]GHG94174.1 hypothetical protein GCM10018780_17240 [Streptomyces lanatus]
MRTMKMALVGLSSAALLVTGGTMASGAPQSVDAKAAWSCTKGAVCFYKGTNGTGTRYQRFVNTNNNYYSINSIRNNGDTSERLDHVKFKWNYTGQSTSHWSCLKPGKRTSGTPSITIDAVRWVASC